MFLTVTKKGGQKRRIFIRFIKHDTEKKDTSWTDKVLPTDLPFHYDYPYSDMQCTYAVTAHH